MNLLPGDMVTISHLYFFDYSTCASLRNGVVHGVNSLGDHTSVSILPDNPDLIDHSFNHKGEPPGVLVFHCHYISKLSPLELLARVAE